MARCAREARCALRYASCRDDAHMRARRHRHARRRTKRDMLQRRCCCAAPDAFTAAADAPFDSPVFVALQQRRDAIFFTILIRPIARFMPCLSPPPYDDDSALSYVSLLMMLFADDSPLYYLPMTLLYCFIMQPLLLPATLFHARFPRFSSRC